MSRRAAFGLALILLAALPAGGRAESIWEMGTPGEPLLPLDAHSLALGGAAEARWDLESGLPANPAQLLALEGFTFSTVIQLRRAWRDLGGGATWDETRQDFPAFQVVLPMPHGLRLGLGYRADTRSRGSFSLPVDIGEVVYELDYYQEGGLHRFPLSLAWEPTDRLRLGLAASLLRGKLEQEWIYDFPDVSVYDNPDLHYRDRRVRRLGRWHGTGAILGLQARLPRGVQASLRYETAADLTGEERLETAGVDATAVRPLSGHMPAAWGVGLAAPFGDALILSLQWSYTDWDTYLSPLPADPLADVSRAALGLEYLIRRERRRPLPPRVIPIRLGLRLGRLPRPDPLSGERVDELLLSLGTGVDVQEGRGSIDLAFFWQQLSVDGGGGESRWGLALSLRTSEIWMKRTTPF
ncbi:MAG: hypothetical protein JW819_03110 [Candidatus Krumholzibacteriota bacterium]|nr:hypothetical protein [Candidatus Krumholzibacteriota bacterium]